MVGSDDDLAHMRAPKAVPRPSPCSPKRTRPPSIMFKKLQTHCGGRAASKISISMPPSMSRSIKPTTRKSAEESVRELLVIVVQEGAESAPRAALSTCSGAAEAEGAGVAGLPDSGGVGLPSFSEAAGGVAETEESPLPARAQQGKEQKQRSKTVRFAHRTSNKQERVGHPAKARSAFLISVSCIIDSLSIGKYGEDNCRICFDFAICANDFVITAPAPDELFNFVVIRELSRENS